MKIVGVDGNEVKDLDLSKGEIRNETVIRDDAEPIDNVSKFAWEDDDYVDILRYVEYTPEELERRAEVEEESSVKSQVKIAAAIFINSQAASLSDGQALEVRNLFNDWAWKDDAGNPIRYIKGDVRRYEGDLWRCRKDHDAQQNWTPSQAHSEWGRIVPPWEIEEWRQPQPGVFDGYTKGQMVTCDGFTWESDYDGLNVWRPGSVGGHWVKIG